MMTLSHTESLFLHLRIPACPLPGKKAVSFPHAPCVALQVSSLVLSSGSRHQAPAAPQFPRQRQRWTVDGGAELCTTGEEQQEQQQQRSAQCQPSLNPHAPPPNVPYPQVAQG